MVWVTQRRAGMSFLGSESLLCDTFVCMAYHFQDPHQFVTTLQTCVFTAMQTQSMSTWIHIYKEQK